MLKQLQKKLSSGECVFHEKIIKEKKESWYNIKNQKITKI
jgi:hypothetical protein